MDTFTLPSSVATAAARALADVRTLSREALASAEEAGIHRARELAELAEDAVGDEGRHLVRRAFGVSSSSDPLIQFCAAPFVHGPALNPEIRRLESTLDRFPEEGQLRQAHERLHHFDLDLPTASAALTSISPPALPADLGASMVALVDGRLARESEHEASRERDEAAVRASGEAGRPAFLEGLRKIRSSEE